MITVTLILRQKLLALIMLPSIINLGQHSYSPHLVRGATGNASELWNAALCKPAWMRDNRAGLGPDKVVDGNQSPDLNNGSCLHSNSQDGGNWWMVDLLDEYLVHQIAVTNRGGPTAYRLKYIYISLFLTDPRTLSNFPANIGLITCAEWLTHFEGTATFECPTPTYARYVKLFMTNPTYLTFCELEAMVSVKRDGLSTCTRTGSRHFHMTANSRRSSVTVIGTAFTRSPVDCACLCEMKGYDLCDGCHWRRDTRECEMFSIDSPCETMVQEPGTDVYLVASHC